MYGFGGLFRTFQDLSWYFRTFQDFSGLFRTFQDFSGLHCDYLYFVETAIILKHIFTSNWIQLIELNNNYPINMCSKIPSVCLSLWSHCPSIVDCTSHFNHSAIIVGHDYPQLSIIPSQLSIAPWRNLSFIYHVVNVAKNFWAYTSHCVLDYF